MSEIENRRERQIAKRENAGERGKEGAHIPQLIIVLQVLIVKQCDWEPRRFTCLSTHTGIPTL